MSKVSNGSSIPRATIHKRILETAAERGDTSMEEIAAQTTGASIDLVERVLTEYGDPALDDKDGQMATMSPSPSADLTAEDAAANSETEGRSGPTPKESAATEDEPDDEPTVDPEGIDPERLTEKQLHTLRTIEANPEATQRELADILDISPATICTRVNAIESFEWKTRREFVEAIFDAEPMPDASPETQPDEIHQLLKHIDELTDRIDSLEQRLADRPNSSSLFQADSRNAHKVVHACLESERISEDEELKIIDDLLTSATR